MVLTPYRPQFGLLLFDTKVFQYIRSQRSQSLSRAATTRAMLLCSLYYKTCLYYKYCLKKIANDSIKRTVRSHAKKIVLSDLCTVYFIKK